MTSPRAGGGDGRSDLEFDGRPLGDLLTEYRPRLRRMLTVRLNPRLRSRVDESDVLQEAFAEVSRRIEDYRQKPALPLFLWVRQVTVQKLLDIQRRHVGAQKRDVDREVLLADQMTGSSISLANALMSAGPTPSQAAEREEELEGLREALDEMRDLDREILLLRHFEGLDLVHCAQVLEISTSAAKMRHLRALDRLSDVLRRHGMSSDLALLGS